MAELHACSHCRLIFEAGDSPAGCPYCGADKSRPFDGDSNGLRYALRVSTPGGERDFVLGGDEVFAGSDAEANAIYLASRHLQDRHARFFQYGGVWWIEALGEVKIGERSMAAHESRALHPGGPIWLGRMPCRLIAFDKNAPPMRESSTRKPLRFTENGVRIGSGADCDEQLPGLMPLHARVAPAGGEWVLFDEARLGDVRVNRQAALQTALRDGDRAEIGPYAFVCQGAALHPDQDGHGVRLECRKVSFTLPDGQRLLEDFDFIIEPNELVGIVGPSGSGKSTLLKTLAGFLRGDAPEDGGVFFDGQRVEELDIETRRAIGYVPQDDVMHQSLPVARALGYYAALRLDAPREQRRERVEEALRLVQLEDRRAAPIVRLSGGQRKRANVAAELVSRPRILFMDEPASGLDPGTEIDLMHQLRGLANRNQTVICTTHAMETVELFDKILVLRPDGAGGPAQLDFCGSPAELRRHYNIPRMADLYRCIDPELNPSAHSTDSKKSNQNKNGKPHQLLRCVRRTLTAPFHWLQAPWIVMRDTTQAIADTSRKRIAAMLWQTLVLSTRYANVLWRDRMFVLLLVLLQPLLLGLMIALAVPADGRDSSSDLLLFLGAVASIWLGLNASIREIVREREILARERLAGLGLGPYLASKVAVLGLIGALQCAIIAGALSARPVVDREDFREHVLGGAEYEQLAPDDAPVNWNAALRLGLPSPEHFNAAQARNMLLGFWLCFLAAIGIGLGASAWSSSGETAVALLPLLVIPQLLFSRIIIGFGRTYRFTDDWPELPGTQALLDAFLRGDVFSVLSAALARLMPSHYGFELLRGLNGCLEAAVGFYAAMLLILGAAGMLLAYMQLRTPSR
ncbi:ATP-binding cassette domain-containing protein [Candidatus Sumerlaeota bacterium]|nr:ATP-binding cassette domain-containing protein [Candidatus Sumerlaeota bacterium]